MEPLIIQTIELLLKICLQDVDGRSVCLIITLLYLIFVSFCSLFYILVFLKLTLKTSSCTGLLE